MSNINTTSPKVLAKFAHFDDTGAHAMHMVRKPATWERGGRESNPLTDAPNRGGAQIVKLRAAVVATGKHLTPFGGGRAARLANALRKPFIWPGQANTI